MDIDSPIVYACVLSAAAGWFVGFLCAVASLMGMAARLNDAEEPHDH